MKKKTLEEYKKDLWIGLVFANDLAKDEIKELTKKSRDLEYLAEKVKEAKTKKEVDAIEKKIQKQIDLEAF